MKYITISVIILLSINCTIVSGYASNKNESISNLQKEIPFLSNYSKIINEYTWAFMRYDHVGNSSIYGQVNMTKPTPGPVMIPANMMSKDLCRIALDVYRENKKETLEVLEGYDLQNMVVGFPYILWHMWASKNSLPCLGQKLSGLEMKVLGNRFFWADFVGDCYSQSLFNTAVLRLCGFSAEEVFTVTIPMHAIVVVKIEDSWLVFDNVKGQFMKNSISDSYIPPAQEVIYWLENDKYFINFGTLSSEGWPYQEDPYSNINASILIDIIGEIVPLLNGSSLGRKNWNINSFLENATVCPDMSTVGMTYTVKDAVGDNPDEKAENLALLNKAFILNQTGGETLNQYDRSIYSQGFLYVDYPQVYANAAKFGMWTSWFAQHFDSVFPKLDYLKIGFWIKHAIRGKIPISNDRVLFSDFSYVCRMGSSIDKALVAYGSMRNMKKNDILWQADDLYVIITENDIGYLAVNTNDGWRYLNFDSGKLLMSTRPLNIKKAFNEKEVIFQWDNLY